jgi:Fe2+ transport system protein B
MRRIGELLGDTNKEIEDLDSKLDHVLEKNEKDFLTAYRFHMLKVQNELMQLKKKANETELKSLQDSKLAELEKEQHRFQMECMDLRRHCDDQEKQIKKLSFRKSVLMEDQEFLDFELRDGKEQNASLKLGLSKNLTALDE